MASIPQVANLAATLIGTEARITSLDDDRTSARALKAVWDAERQAAIRDGAWNFAMRRAGLSSESNPAETIYPWAYRYILPADCLRVHEAFDLGAAWTVEMGALLCDRAGPVYIRYCRDVPQAELWDEHFAAAFAARLAMAVGPKIAGSAYDLEAGVRLYRERLSGAKRSDAQENPPIEQDESDWIMARWGFV